MVYQRISLRFFAALTIHGYQLESDVRRDRTDTTNGVGGGLLVYSRIGLRILPYDKYCDNNFNQFCAFSMMTDGSPLHFVLIYRPPNSNMTNVNKLCRILTNMDKNTIVIGDFNLPNVNWQELTATEARARTLLEAVVNEDLAQLVNFPTHLKGNTLDLLITNCQEKVVQIEKAGRLGKSDHDILMIDVCAKLSTTITLSKKPNWNKADANTLLADLSEVNWQAVFGTRSVEEKWAIFKQLLCKAVESHVPLSTCKPATQPRWINREIIKMVRRKKSAWRTFRLYPTEENLGIYKQAEKRVSVKIRNAKRSLEKKLANSNTSNARTFANFIKSKTKGRVGIGPLKDQDGFLVTEDGEMAEILNSFFANVFVREGDLITPLRRPETEEEMAEVTITERQIKHKILKLKEHSAGGPDNISAKILKTAVHEIAQPLQLIFNESLRTGQVPLDWKKAEVVPIFKKGTRGDPGNYRPVSLTSIAGKVMESVLKDAIMDHLVSKSLIRESQHGFMPGKSCTTNLLVFMDGVTAAVDQGVPVDIFYLDFSKAFDKVPHKRLIYKLRQKGMGAQLLDWIENWLSNRTQVVRVGNKKSGESKVTSGVPQGSVLGPTLFTVFIDDIDDYTEGLDAVGKFADDTKGMKLIRGPEDRDKLQKALDNLVTWASEWGMEFNYDKCKIMNVGANNPGYDYTMAGRRLRVVEEEKDIGVWITKNLKPSKQCQAAANMAGAVLTQLSKNFHYRDRHTFKKLYLQYVRPHLEFASPVWSPWSVADKNAIEKIQIRAVNMVSGLTGSTYEEKCRELGLQTLEERRNQQDLTQAHKILTGKDKVNPEILFEKVRTRPGPVTRERGDADNLEGKRARLDIRKYSYSVRIVESWNRLDSIVKNAPTTSQFKRAIKSRLLN